MEVFIISTIKIEMFKAKWGESFLITLYKESKPIHILIDAGFVNTYDTFLKKRILEIANDGMLDILVFSHIDQDHIGGGLKFLKENNRNNMIQIGDVWYNAYRHLEIENVSAEGLKEDERKKLEKSISGGMLAIEERINKESSGRQGSILGALILNGKYNWNKKFYGNVVCTKSKIDSTFYSDIKIEVLSPDTEGLEKLKKEWKKELDKIGIYKETKDGIFDDAFEVLISKKFQKFFLPKAKPVNFKQKDLKTYMNSDDFIDKDSVNGSSISFMLEFMEKRMLFLADSHCSTIIKNLKCLRKKYSIEEGTAMFFDVIKISHHGSCGNTNEELLKLIDSDKYIISTNGDMFNHPDLQTIAQIVCRPTEKERVLYFNYENVARRFDKKEWMAKYKYSVNLINEDIIKILLDN